MMDSRGLNRTDSRFRLLLVSLLVTAIASADAAGNSESIRALLNSSCLGCHNDSLAQGGLNLRDLQWDLDDIEIRRRWVLVHDRVSRGEMPPTPGLLSRADRQRLVAGLSFAIRSVETDEALRHGRASMSLPRAGEAPLCAATD